MLTKFFIARKSYTYFLSQVLPRLFCLFSKNLIVAEYVWPHGRSTCTLLSLILGLNGRVYV